MVVFGMANSVARRRIEICQSRITIRSTASMFSSAVMVDGRPIRDAYSKPRSGSLNSATHLGQCGTMEQSPCKHYPAPC